LLSLPAWGEWIEIGAGIAGNIEAVSLSPHGESGLKSMHPVSAQLRTAGLSPHGESGLKFVLTCGVDTQDDVSPRMGRVD